MRSRRAPMPRMPRHTLQVPAEIVRLHDFRLLSDSIDNLSMEGALAGPSLPATPGEKMLVSFRVPRSSQWIDVDATVVRVVGGRRVGDHGRQLGLKFEPLSIHQRQWLQHVLQHAPPAPPSARPGRRMKEESVRELVVGSGWAHSRFGQMLVRWWEK
jgi:hypothetical protein